MKSLNLIGGVWKQACGPFALKKKKAFEELAKGFPMLFKGLVEELKRQDSIRKKRGCAPLFDSCGACIRVFREEIKMRKVYLKISLVIALFLPVLDASAVGVSGGRNFRAVLSGLQEVPVNSTTGRGVFRARLDSGETSLTYELTYSGLEGTETTAAHVHLGQRGVNGGISFFLCGGGTKPPCPSTQGTVTGTIVADDVIGPEEQGIAPGEFAEIIAEMRRGVAYANVHTNKHPGGEIRGQIKASRVR